MKIEERRQGHVLVIEVSGDVDNTDVPALREQLGRRIRPEDLRVVLDLPRLTFASTLGFGALIETVRGLKRRGGEAVLAGPAGFFRRTLKALILDRDVRIFDSVEQAVAAFGKAPDA